MLGRRELMLGTMGFGLATAAGPRALASRERETAQVFDSFGLVAGGGIDQTATLQEAFDKAAETGTPIFLPPGTYGAARLNLKSGTQVHGVPGKSILSFGGDGDFVTVREAENVRLSGVTLDGGARPIADALLTASTVKGFDVSTCRFVNSAASGLSLRTVSGRINDCEFSGIRNAALFSEDAAGLEVAHNHVDDCGDNGILIWRSEAGEDGSIVMANRIENIAAKSGGAGQNGNGVNVFRAGSVLVTGNRITGCAFSAIRSNGGSNCQMLGNSCARIGEVALYAEFEFEGALIANNLVDRAAMGISVTNFKQGGRLAVVQGNLIRNLFFRKDEDARGTGIAVEADSIVSGNVIEGAPAYGILVGWGEYLRDISVTGNLIRAAHIGIGVSSDGGYALITNNMITGAKDGAIRAMDGPKVIGPDLALASAESFRNLGVFANVTR
jgi:uncharacterized secreted repeat protein (TIGR03808 family)